MSVSVLLFAMCQTLLPRRGVGSGDETSLWSGLVVALSARFGKGRLKCIYGFFYFFWFLSLKIMFGALGIS